MADQKFQHTLKVYKTAAQMTGEETKDIFLQALNKKIQLHNAEQKFVIQLNPLSSGYTDLVAINDALHASQPVQDYDAAVKNLNEQESDKQGAKTISWLGTGVTGIATTVSFVKGFQSNRANNNEQGNQEMGGAAACALAAAGFIYLGYVANKALKKIGEDLTKAIPHASLEKQHWLNFTDEKIAEHNKRSEDALKL